MSDQTFELLIKTTADPTGAIATTSALKDVQTQGVATAVAITGGWRQLAAVTGQSVAQLKALKAAQDEAAVEFQQKVGRGPQVTDATVALSGEALALENARIAAARAASADQQAAEQALIEARRAEGAVTYDQFQKQVQVTQVSAQELAIQGEVNAIVAARRDSVAAQITDNEAQVALARDEVAIRMSTLATLRSETLSQSALNDLMAEENALLEVAAAKNTEIAAGGLLSGANLNKAKGEATVLARELATGSLNARTLGSFLGSLGPTLTIGAIAGLGLYEVISRIGEEQKKWNTDLLAADESLEKQVGHWSQLAAFAKTSHDVGALGSDMVSGLDQMEKKISELTDTQLPMLEKVSDTVQKALTKALSFGISDGGAGHYQAEVDAITNSFKNLEQAAVLADRAMILWAQESVTDWERISKGGPDAAANGITFYKSQILDLKEKQSALDLTTAAGIRAWAEYESKIADADSKVKLLGHSFLDVAKSDQVLIDQLRDDQKIISDNPFFGADTKQSALHSSFLTEQQDLINAIGKTKSALDQAMGSGSTEEVARLRQELQKLMTDYVELEYKIQTSTFSGALRGELTQWVNSFGTAAHQVAGVITGTLNTAIRGTSQALTGLIFGTETWKQAFSSAVQSIVGDIIQIGLQFAVTRLFMSVVNTVFGATDASAATASAAPVAAAWSAAATSASIATYGLADTVGVAAYIAGLAAGKTAAIASAGAGFKEGGFTGHTAEDQIAGVVHGKEYVFTAEETEKLGVPFLHSLAAAAGVRAKFGYQDGGYVYMPPPEFPPATGAGSDPRYGYGDMPSGGITATAPLWGGWDDAPVQNFNSDPYGSISVPPRIISTPQGDVLVRIDPNTGEATSVPITYDDSGVMVDANTGIPVDDPSGIADANETNPWGADASASIGSGATDASGFDASSGDETDSSVAGTGSMQISDSGEAFSTAVGTSMDPTGQDNSGGATAVRAVAEGGVNTDPDFIAAKMAKKAGISVDDYLAIKNAQQAIAAANAPQTWAAWMAITGAKEVGSTGEYIGPERVLPKAGTKGGFVGWFNVGKLHTGGPIDDDSLILPEVGEFMLRSSARRRYGDDYLQALNEETIPVPTLRSSGIRSQPTGSPSIASSSPNDKGPDIHVHVYHDLETWARKREESPSYRKRFVKSVNGSRRAGGS